MNKYLSLSLRTITAVLCLVYAVPAVALGSGYCTPFRVLCNDDTMFIGKCVPKGVIASNCYFEDPPGFEKNIKRKDWAYQVCMKDHRGVKETHEPQFFSSTEIPALIESEKQNKQLYDAVKAFFDNTHGPEEAQSVFDFYIQSKLGTYYEPITAK